MNLSMTAPEHWPGMLATVPHSLALLIRDALGACWPLTPADCRRKADNSGREQKEMKERLWARHQRYGFVRCHWCGEAFTRVELTKDHVTARCFGGSDNLSNIVLACEPCNRRRGKEQARILEALRVEWTIAELRLAV